MISGTTAGTRNSGGQFVAGFCAEDERSAGVYGKPEALEQLVELFSRTTPEQDPVAVLSLGSCKRL